MYFLVCVSPWWGSPCCFSCGSAGKEFACNAGYLGSIPGLGRSPGEGKGYPLQYSGVENSMDSMVHGVAKSRTQLSDSHFMVGEGLWGGLQDFKFHYIANLRLPQWFRGKESACSVKDVGFIPGLRRSPGGQHSNPLQYSCLENTMDKGVWRATVHRVAKNQTQQMKRQPIEWEKLE